MQVNSNPVDALVLFSGPGGSSLGLRQAGVRNTIGVDNDASAAKTAETAGLATIVGDVQELSPRVIRDHLGTGSLLIQSSPPCQGLSRAGKGKGRQDVELLLTFLELVGQLSMTEAAAWCRWYRQTLTERCSDNKSPLTFETVRWVAELDPEYVMLEQVTTALPIWQAIGDVLRSWGYSVWTGIVNAEQYGVPQARRRAILLASRVSEVEAPAPTHSQYHRRSPSRLDPDVPKWISMAEALDWGPGREPRPAIGGETFADCQWVYDRPSPTIVGSFAPDVVAKPGYRKAGDPPRQRTPGSVRVTLTEAGVLQSFPADYPWRGSETAQFQQVGNAVPPLLQQALTSSLLAHRDTWSQPVSQTA